jgi:ABC-type multidrug transport system ATPase subunit
MRSPLEHRSRQAVDRLIQMSRPLPPNITVSSGEWQRTFAPGNDVVIGRDVRADVRVAHLGVSRLHVVLRYLDGQWVAIDNQSLNGMFVGGRRVYSVDIRNGEAINVGNPEGPRLTFALTSPVGPPPDDRPTTPTKHVAEGKTEVLGFATAVARAVRPGDRPTAPSGSTTIGRAPDNEIVIPDVLASDYHAYLVPTARGVQIVDVTGANGTFVNGQQVKHAILCEGDVVTIGNLDLVMADGTLTRRSAPAAEASGLEVRGISLTVDGNRTLLDHISFSAKPASLTAVIGPSGSGKSTLSKVVVGGTRPNSGTVSFEGHDVHAEYASTRSRIGMVPQDDVVHRLLTSSEALSYAAELRMPPGTTKRDRQQVIAQVLEELELTPHAQTRVDKLSGGQRKRVSVALELLTGPSLLVLDEPTTGLDPALDRQVMTMLRGLADAGRVVVVVTHSLDYLDVCDQVLLLGPGGKQAFFGPPTELGPAMGSTDWADIFTDLEADPDAAQQRFLEQRDGGGGDDEVTTAPEQPVEFGRPARTGLWRQVSTLARRQVRLVVADRRYFLYLALLPFIVGLLPLAVAGDVGFNKPPPDSIAPFEPKQLVVLLNLGAIFMGTALTIRELVGERTILRREQAAGLSTSAYVLAKIGVFGAAAVAQSALLVLVVTAPKLGKSAPSTAAALGSPILELFIGVAATCVASAVLGLAVSAVAHNNNQVLPLMAVTLTAQLVLAGGFIPVTGTTLLDPISWFTPARWGLAATASTADLSNTVVGVPKDAHWKHTASAWAFDVVMLGVLSVLYAGFVRWKIRLTSS